MEADRPLLAHLIVVPVLLSSAAMEKENGSPALLEGKEESLHEPLAVYGTVEAEYHDADVFGHEEDHEVGFSLIRLEKELLEGYI